MKESINLSDLVSEFLESGTPDEILVEWAVSQGFEHNPLGILLAAGAIIWIGKHVDKIYVSGGN